MGVAVGEAPLMSERSSGEGVLSAHAWARMTKTAHPAARPPAKALRYVGIFIARPRSSASADMPAYAGPAPVVGLKPDLRRCNGRR